MISPEYKVIIPDTSCLIILDKINELHLLDRLSDNVLITSDIQHEYGSDLPDWIKVVDPNNRDLERINNNDIDIGEASAIALSITIKNSILVIDDLKARKLLEKLDLRFTGTLGLIVKAKEVGIIDSMGSIVNKLRNTNFRISEDLINLLLMKYK